MKRLPLLAALAALLLVVACGSDGGGSGLAQGPDGRTKLRVLVGPVMFEPTYIGVQQGFFAQEGLDVEVVTGGTAAQQIPQIVSGDVDIAATGGVSLIAAVQKGIPVRAIMGLQNAVTEPITSGILVRQDSDIQDYGDLAGKVVGLQALNETTHAATLLAAEDAGVDIDSVEFVQLPLPNLNDAVLSGQVDAVYNIGSFFPAGLGMGLRTIGSPAAEFLTGGPNVLWFTSQQFIGQNPAVVEAFVRAMTRATDFANANPTLVQDQQIEHTEQDPNYIRSAPLIPFASRLDRDGVQGTVDAMVRYGFLPSAPAYEDIVWEGAPQTS